MITQRVFIPFYSLLLSFNISSYAEVPNLNVIGFSPNGHYFSFEQYGYNEGNATPYSHLYFIDVKNNNYVTKPIMYEAHDDLKTDSDVLQARVRNRSRLFATNIFEDLRLLYPLPGKRVIHHPLTDLAVKNHHVSFTPDTPLGGLSYDSYALDLLTSRIGSDKNPECNGMGTAKIFKLTLTHNDGQTQILQKDTSLPASRACPLNYRIQDVYLYDFEQKRYIAILINMIYVGFEGENMRYLAVTGLINPPTPDEKPAVISLPPRPKTPANTTPTLPATQSKPNL